MPSATMACATGFLPSAQCRTTAASAGTQRAAAAAALLATATTARAGSTGPAAKMVRRKREAARRSCASPRFDRRGARASLAHHHAAVQEQQQVSGRAAGGGGREQPVELVGFAANLVTMKRHTRNVVASPSFRTARGDNAAAFRFDDFVTAGIGGTFFSRLDDLDHPSVPSR